ELPRASARLLRHARARALDAGSRLGVLALGILRRGHPAFDSPRPFRLRPLRLAWTAHLAPPGCLYHPPDVLTTFRHTLTMASCMDDAGKTREELLIEMRALRHTAQAVLESTSEGILSIDANGRITLVNRAAERMFGYGQHELTGQTLEVLLPE